jgi:hypothetical protein
MQLDRMRIVGTEPLSNLMQSGFYPMGLAFEYTNTGKYKISLIGVVDRSGIIEIE